MEQTTIVLSHKNMIGCGTAILAVQCSPHPCGEPQQSPKPRAEGFFKNWDTPLNPPAMAHPTPS